MIIDDQIITFFIIINMIETIYDIHLKELEV